MKAIVIDEYGSVEELKERQILKPVVTYNEVLIRILATSVNPVDWKTRKGDLQQQLQFFISNYFRVRCSWSYRRGWRRGRRFQNRR